MNRVFAAFFALLLLDGCASYGLHHPARVLPAGGQSIGVTFDLMHFFPAEKDPERRGSDELFGYVVVPGLEYRVGVGHGLELALGGFPIGVRGALRVQPIGDATSRFAAAMEGGLTLFALADLTATSDSDLRLLVMPDLAVAGGVSPYQGGEAFLALRYLWFPGKVAGKNFVHTPALTLGFTHQRKPIELSAEGTVFYSPSSGDLIVGPGIGAGLLFGR